VGALPLRILVHSCRVEADVADQDAVQWVEGTPGATGVVPELGVAWPCVLFLPLVGEEAPAAQRGFRPRAVQRPTLLFNPGDVVGRSPSKDVRVLIHAPDLAPWTGGDDVLWEVDGIPQPAGPPGRPLVVQATVKRVVD
jgi:hypothetical protein